MRKLIVAVLIEVVIYSHCATFGDTDRYTCHCKNDEPCDKDTGGCSDGCARGWYGASCQKQNVALGKPSSQVQTINNRTSELAVDGDTSTNIPGKCIDTGRAGTIIWWRVDLEEVCPINHITIFYQNDGTYARHSLNGFSLHVSKENQDPEQLCYKDNTTVGIRLPPAVNNIKCSQTITGRYVNISNLHTQLEFRFLALCEVEIYVCSVGTFGSNCTIFCHCLNNERCSETGHCPVGCADGWTGLTCSQTCDNGVYGARCSKKCSDRNCLVETSPCNYINGNCEGGCKEGFSELDCVKCEDGVYGAGCSKKCSDRYCLVETSPCNHINGSCQGGCKKGFSGLDCVKRCEEGVYGAGCSKKCSDRKCKDSNLQCNSKTGECVDGCQPGHQSMDCTEECDDGTYGQDCQFKCSARFCQPQDKDKCSKIDGACDCLEGYEGTACTVSKSTFRSTDSNTGSSTILIIGIFVVGLIIGLVAGALGVMFIMKRRQRSKANKSQTVTSNQSSNNITQQETTINQPVTQPSSNNQDNAYSQLTTIYQNENAYEQLGKT